MSDEDDEYEDEPEDNCEADLEDEDNIEIDLSDEDDDSDYEEEPEDINANESLSGIKNQEILRSSEVVPVKRNEPRVSPVIPNRHIDEVTIDTPPIVNKREPSNTPVTSPVEKANKVSSVGVTEVVNKVVDKVDNVNQVSSVKRKNYDSLDVSKLYNFVALFMKRNGVKNSGISRKTLNDEFGSNNINKLINKSYLIQLYDGTLTFNR